MLRPVRRLVLPVVVAVLGVLMLAGPAAAGPSKPSQPSRPAQEGDQAPQLNGRLHYPKGGKDTPVSGVEVTVKSADGSFEKTVATDATGTFHIELPKPGSYTASIDTKALPEKVRVLNDRSTLQLEVSPGETRLLLFPLGTGPVQGKASKWEQLPDRIASGLRFGLVLAMCAVGLSLIFGTTGLVNFAHGEMVTLGGLMAYLFNVTIGLNLLIAIPLAVLAGAAFGALFNRGVWKPLRGRGTGLVAMMIVSFGIGLALRYVFLYQFRGPRRSLQGYEAQTASVHIGPADLVPRDVWIMVISLVVLLGVALFLQRTRVGKAIRAVSDDAELAESTGINVERVIAWVWIAGGGLAALGGIFQGLDQEVHWQTGSDLLLLIFAAVILGGLGSAYGALLGGVAIGLAIELSSLVVDTELRLALALMAMIIVLLARPQGIMGYAERVG
jgi:branched-chain amino acid transport system permease protein